MNRLGKQEQLPSDVHTVGAEFSDCGLYRYALWRIWGAPGGPIAAFIGMNPSSADAHHDDATVRKCGQYARRWGYAGMLMINLWAIRGTDPEEALRGDMDPVGPKNDAWLEEFAETSMLDAGQFGLDWCPIGIFVAAWGNQGARALNGAPRGAVVAEMLTRHQDLCCLGITKAGQPKHPARISNDLEPVLYRRRKEAKAG